MESGLDYGVLGFTSISIDLVIGKTKDFQRQL